MEKRSLPGKTAKYSVLSGMVPTVLLSPVAQATTGGDGEHGVLHVPGALTESAYCLEMSSADPLGDTRTGVPQRLTPGNDMLTHYIASEHTWALLETGACLAHVNLRLSYE